MQNVYDTDASLILNDCSVNELLTSVSELSSTSDEIIIFPNPTRDKINLKFCLEKVKSFKVKMSKPEIGQIAEALKEKFGDSILSQEQQYDFPVFISLDVSPSEVRF